MNWLRSFNPLRVDWRRVLDYWPRVPAGLVAAAATIALIWTMSNAPTALARVPELTGLRSNAADAFAGEFGLLTKNVRVMHGGVAGTVVDQTPKAGTFMQRGAGARQVVVPDVTGMPLEQARMVLERADLEIGAVIYKAVPQREPGRVVETTPVARSRVDEGSGVDMTVPLPVGR
jgi:serine/threonine-protein kinase